LQDTKGQVSSLFNRGKTFFFDQHYQSSINDFRLSSYLANFEPNTQKSNRFIGMAHFYLANHDSSIWYLEDSFEYYSNDPQKKLSVLPFLIISYTKLNDKNNSMRYLEEFNQSMDEEDPHPDDYILTNWMAYEALKDSEYKDEASEYLENAYLQLKTESKNIKNKKDRNKFLKTKFNQKIIEIFKQS